MKQHIVIDYLDSQLAEHGRPTVLAMPMVYPREVLTALDVLAWERWTGPAGGWGAKDPGRLQGYICPIARGLQGILANESGRFSHAIIPHTCDSLQGLGSLVRSRPQWGVQVLRFRLPRGTDLGAARGFLRREVEQFIDDAQQAFERAVSSSKLIEAIKLHRALDRALGRLLADRPWLPTTDQELYAALSKLTYLHPSDMLTEVVALEGQVDKQRRRRGHAIVVTGILPEPPGLLESFRMAGLYVAADDYALVGRRISSFDGLDERDPVGTIVNRLLHLPPCPTRSADVDTRVDRLVHLARRSGSQGVVIHTVRSCEPELFDIPLVRRGLEDAGLKVLHLETEIEPEVTGQMETRIEAFAELLETLQEDE